MYLPPNNKKFAFFTYILAALILTAISLSIYFEKDLRKYKKSSRYQEVQNCIDLIKTQKNKNIIMKCGDIFFDHTTKLHSLEKTPKLFNKIYLSLLFLHFLSYLIFLFPSKQAKKESSDNSSHF